MCKKDPISSTRISLVVMLSGKGKRFGSNKLLIPFHGMPLYQHALRQAYESGANHVTVVTAYKEIAIFVNERYPDFSVVDNPYPDHGISESIKRGLLYELEQSQDTESRFLTGCCFLTGDMPLLKPSSLAGLITYSRSHPEDICMLSDGNRKGNPAVFPARLFEELLLLDGDQGGKAVARQHPEDIKTITIINKDELCDIDTPEDLERLRRRMLL